MPDAPGASSRPARGTLLGFDFGLARIGVAVGEFESAQASALTTIEAENSAARFAAIETLLDEWQPVQLVVGLPLDAEGEAQERTPRCRRFANQLSGRYGLPVALVDERFSSVEADDQLIANGRRRWRDRKATLDAAAAQIILQQYLDSH